MKKLLLFFLSLAAFGQVTIPLPVTLSDTGNNFCRFTGTILVGGVTGAPYVRATFGTTMGGAKPYSTYPYQTTNFGNPGNLWALDIASLNTSTTYYAIIYGRPNANNSTGEVATAEQTCTTTNASTTPTLPTEYNPTYPDTTTSGYTIVPMIVNGSNQYAVQTNTTHTGGVFCAGDKSWTLTAGETIDQVLTTLAGVTGGAWGAVLELPQGSTGQVPDTNVYNSGFILPVIAVDPCASGISDTAHRFNMIRTHQVGTADFPPLGFRTGPNWASKLATFQAQVPTTGVSDDGGQIFYFLLGGPSGTPIHHWWFSNFAMSVNTAAGNGPWGAYIHWGKGEGNPDDAKTPPSYIVTERLHYITPAPPAFAAVGIEGTIGTNVLNASSYIVGFQQGTGGNNIGLGVGTQDCSIGPFTNRNNEVDAAGQGIYYGSNAYQTCGSSPGRQMHDIVTAMNAIYNPPTWLNPYNSGSTYAMPDGVNRGNFREPLEHKNGQIVLTDGNWTDGCFGGETPGDALLLFNLTNPQATTGATGLNNHTITNNYMRHCVQPFTGFGASAEDAHPGVGPDAAPIFNVLYANNLAVDLGSTNYAAMGRSGLGNGYLTVWNGFQNFNANHNSFAFTDADSGSNAIYFIPAPLYVWDGGMYTNAFNYSYNVAYFSQGVTGVTGSGITYYPTTTTSAGCGGACSNFPVAPAPTGTNYSTIFNSVFIGLGASVTATGTWTQNLWIGGNKATGAEPWPELTSADFTTISANMPNIGGDSYPNPTCTTVGAGCMAARNVAAGLLNIAAADMTLTPNSANFMGATGANITQVENHLGIVRAIAATPASTTALVSWTAPDTRNCSVDWSTDGVTWASNRLTAAQGATAQSVTISGLASSTLYHYRVLCYYDQSRPWFSFPAESTNMVTAGTFTTLGGGSINSVIMGGKITVGGKVVIQ